MVSGATGFVSDASGRLEFNFYYNTGVTAATGFTASNYVDTSIPGTKAFIISNAAEDSTANGVITCPSYVVDQSVRTAGQGGISAVGAGVGGGGVGRTLIRSL